MDILHNVFFSQISPTEISFKKNIKITENEKPEDVQFSFAKHFQDHMVLQKAPVKAQIYGFSSGLGKTVAVVVSLLRLLS